MLMTGKPTKKRVNYAKQSQFPKSQIIYNRNSNNQLQRKIDNGHLVKTNPNKANLVPSAVEGSIKTTTHLRRIQKAGAVFLSNQGGKRAKFSNFSLKSRSYHD
jgi:hypothetical protein